MAGWQCVQSGGQRLGPFVDFVSGRTARGRFSAYAALSRPQISWVCDQRPEAALRVPRAALQSLRDVMKARDAQNSECCSLLPNVMPRMPSPAICIMVTRLARGACLCSGCGVGAGRGLSRLGIGCSGSQEWGRGVQARHGEEHRVPLGSRAPASPHLQQPIASTRIQHSRRHPQNCKGPALAHSRAHSP
jgi:hypothetical protein